ncbi:hypothetical protein NDU88_006753 [Pleurodeles waltl]|uniref:Uncharacterized protein n=1 Tax=Pleurodeles waltl TaxID=8319 RepID=A0AAV7VRK3_PLEWA|nr:hypothetical protein NDU88_006753 [Pleurodeles waltl]
MHPGPPQWTPVCRSPPPLLRLTESREEPITSQLQHAALPFHKWPYFSHLLFVGIGTMGREKLKQASMAQLQ